MSYTNEEIILKAVNADIDKLKRYNNERREKTIPLYKKCGGKKNCGHYDGMKEEYFEYIDEDEEEGYLPDFYWIQIMNCKSQKINPLSAYEIALLCKKKAEELDISWTKPMKSEFWGGHYSRPYLKCIITPKLAKDYQEYLEDVKSSNKRMKVIEESLKSKDISIYKLNKDNWIHVIANYYVDNKIDLEDYIVFRPFDSKSKNSLFKLTYHTIEYDTLEEKITEIMTINGNVEKTGQLLDKIIEYNSIDEDILVKFNIHQYIVIITKYWQENPDLFKEDYVFCPVKSKDQIKEHKINVYSIDIKDIMRMNKHIEYSVLEKNKELVNDVKKWSSENNKNEKEFEMMGNKEWDNLIKSYYKENNIDIPEDIIYYIPSKTPEPFCLNYYIIDHFDLTDDSIFSLFKYDDYDDYEEGSDDDYNQETDIYDTYDCHQESDDDDFIF